MRSTGRAYVRGLCFRDGTPPSECRACLSVTARSLAAGWGTTTWCAGISTRFVSYADTDASSPAEDAVPNVDADSPAC